jgi:hypothetical protein
MNELTQQYLSEILDYNPVTGVFTWKVSRGSNKAGNRAGSSHSRGYRVIRINGKNYKEHRLAWLYYYGYMPTKQLDHRSGVKDDNRIDNLREASNAENQQNLGKNINNTSGFTGVTYDKRSGKWMARIKKDGKRIFLGSFNTPELAYAAYLKAKSELHTFNPIPR